MEGSRKFSPEQFIFTPEEEEFLKETAYSPAAQTEKRYAPYVHGEAPYPHEGTVATHHKGSLRRGLGCLTRENKLRGHAGVPELKIDRKFYALLLTTHDIEEVGPFQGDIPHGTKTWFNQEIAEKQFNLHLEKIRNQEKLYVDMLRVKKVIKKPESSVEGRLWKATEQIAFLETARQEWRLVLEEALNNEDEVNQTSGIYIEPTLMIQEDGTFAPPQKRKSHALIWDILRNSLPRLARHAQEFIFIEEYFKQHQEELHSMVQTLLVNAESNEYFYREYISMKIGNRQFLDPKLNYATGDEVARQGQEFLAHLESLKIEADENESELIELLEGQITSLQSVA
ncbi:hypothetical protein HYW32_03230 [Candidatus Berkelbacteria bacterium]|nr:hypothetical protein [Candidatus Berkelbacteria bacterium]